MSFWLSLFHHMNQNVIFVIGRWPNKIMIMNIIVSFSGVCVMTKYTLQKKRGEVNEVPYQVSQVNYLEYSYVVKVVVFLMCFLSSDFDKIGR